MNKRNDTVYINDILESINQIVIYVHDKSEFEFSTNLLLQDAVIRRFEIIGEAASKISNDYKLAHESIEWGLMKDMRNKLIHEYFGISPNTIYQTIHRDLPVLKEKLEKLV